MIGDVLLFLLERRTVSRNFTTDKVISPTIGFLDANISFTFICLHVNSTSALFDWFSLSKILIEIEFRETQQKKSSALTIFFIFSGILTEGISNSFATTMATNDS